MDAERARELLFEYEMKDLEAVLHQHAHDLSWLTLDSLENKRIGRMITEFSREEIVQIARREYQEFAKLGLCHDDPREVLVSRYEEFLADANKRGSPIAYELIPTIANEKDQCAENLIRMIPLRDKIVRNLTERLNDEHSRYPGSESMFSHVHVADAIKDSISKPRAFVTLKCGVLTSCRRVRQIAAHFGLEDRDQVSYSKTMSVLENAMPVAISLVAARQSARIYG